MEREKEMKRISIQDDGFSSAFLSFMCFLFSLAIENTLWTL